MFDNILERGETIINIYKPNAKRYWKGVRLSLFFVLFPPVLIMAVLFTALSLGSLPFILWHFARKQYNNTYYCYTTKRLIIRTGTIGIDYKSLEYKDITLTNINVGFLDKKFDTGNLLFSSPSTAHAIGFNFSHIEHPYDEMRNIKEYMDSVKNQK